MHVTWGVVAIVSGGVLVVWSCLIFLYFLVIALLERSDADEDSATEGSAFDLLASM